MKRGDLVTIAIQGDFGKPRPALVIQSDRYDEHTTVTVLPVTSALVAAPCFASRLNRVLRTACKNVHRSWPTRP